MKTANDATAAAAAPSGRWTNLIGRKASAETGKGSAGPDLAGGGPGAQLTWGH